MTARPELPSGTLTFLFTDIEGSTEMARALGIVRWQEVLERHGRILRSALAENDGTLVRVEGDSFFAVFTSPAAAVAAAVAAQRALAARDWPAGATVRVRMGLHTGEAQAASADTGADFVGFEVHRAARIAAAPHGGQTVLSETTRALVADALPPGVTLRDLGEHELKDLRIERLYQLDIAGLPGEFAPLRTIDRTANNLPAQLTTFVGREREIARVLDLLRERRLVTLTGPGGTGKTRLGLQVAGAASGEFPDGVYFVALGSLAEASLVPSGIAHTLRIAASGNRPPLERVVDHLADRTVLLVLDNFEHLLGAANVVGEVLRGCPRVKVIATSRAPLMVSGEQEFPVPPLGLPDAAAVPLETFRQYEAVRLFIERAVAARPDFAVTNENAPAVAEICARLDGLPLAIELAAARIRILSPQAILARLERRLALLAGGPRDLPARQRTLRGAIAWSYDMLGADARRLFAAFSVFSGGAALAQAEIVCAETARESEVFDGLVALAGQSLVGQRDVDGEPRFGMLQTIREFAEERLEESGGADPVRRRHAHAFRDLAERAAPDMFGPRQRTVLDELEQEHDNLRAALSWSIAAADTLTALRVLAALWRFWQMRGHLHEAQERARQVLALPWSDADRTARLHGLEATAGIAYWKAEMDEAGRLYAEALELAREIGEPSLIANALYDLSFVFILSRSDLERGHALLSEARALYAGLGDAPGVARTRLGESMVLYQLGDQDGAGREARDALLEFRRMGDSFLIAFALGMQGLAAMRRGRFDVARDLLEESLRLRTSVRDLAGIALELHALAMLAEAEGSRDRALRLAGASRALGVTSGTALMPFSHLADDDSLAREPPADPADRAIWDEGAALSVEDAVAYALSGSAGLPGDRPPGAGTA